MSSAVSALRAFFTDDRLFWTVMLAIVLASRYLIRDLVECSVNTWLVALTWLGIYLWIKGRDAAGGLAIGFAIALKMTAALFVPYFLLKRQWKMAGFTMLFAVLFTVAPALRLGPASMAEHLRVWATRVIEGSRQPDPSRGILGDEPYNNMSLRPAMGRYLTALPQGHAGRINHVGYVDVLSLEPRVAGWIVRVATVTLVLGAAWAMRRPVTRRDDSAILWECAAVSVLLLLLSPITWGQHCVGLFPAMFLIAGRIVRREPLALWMKAALFFFIIASLVLNRGILGKEGAILVESYRPETWAILGIFLVTLACARRSHAVPA